MSNETTAVEKLESPSMIKTTKNLHEMLYDRMAEFERAVPKHVNIEMLFKVAVIAHSRNPELLQCTGESIILALMDCGQLDLSPNGILGEAYLIPRENGKLSKKYGKRIVEMHFQPGYRGLMKLARNSGEIAYMDAKPVYPGDQFEAERGSKPFLRHIESDENADRTDNGIVKVYSMAFFRDPNTPPSFAVFTKTQVEKRRARSACPKSDMWVNWYPEAAAKTIIRNHVKQLPASTDLQAAIAIDEAVEIGNTLRLSEINPAYSGPPIQHAELPPVVSGTQKAHDAMTDANGPQQAEVVEETDEGAQTEDTASDSPPADSKAKDTLWLNWCEFINTAGVVDTVWSEKQLVKYAEEQGIEFGKMTQKQCDELVVFMAEDPEAVQKWIEDAI